MWMVCLRMFGGETDKSNTWEHAMTCWDFTPATHTTAASSFRSSMTIWKNRRLLLSCSRQGSSEAVAIAVTRIQDPGKLFYRSWIAPRCACVFRAINRLLLPFSHILLGLPPRICRIYFSFRPDIRCGRSSMLVDAPQARAQMKENPGFRRMTKSFSRVPGHGINTRRCPPHLKHELGYHAPEGHAAEFNCASWAVSAPSCCIRCGFGQSLLVAIASTCVIMMSRQSPPHFLLGSYRGTIVTDAAESCVETVNQYRTVTTSTAFDTDERSERFRFRPLPRNQKTKARLVFPSNLVISIFIADGAQSSSDRDPTAVAATPLSIPHGSLVYPHVSPLFLPADRAPIDAESASVV